MGAALETVVVQHQHAKEPKPIRISRKTKVAIDHMVLEGLKRSEAAQKAGLTDHALYVALTKPHVLAYMQSVQGVLRTSAAARSIARVDKLADDSESDHVKLQSNVFLLGIEGISPTQRIENTHVHRNTQPGLVINFITGAVPGDDAQLIDGQAHEVEQPKQLKGLPRPVPHPAMRNAADQAAFAGDVEVPASATRGEK